MTVGGGEAADQMVRMMLSGTEVTVRLTGSALKNLLALSLALARNHKQISGKVNLGKMLRETRDLRQFPMTPEQYRQFEKLARKQKLLFSAVRDRDDRGKLVDVILPVTELDRANQIFERLLSQTASREGVSSPQKAPQERQGSQDERHQERPQQERQDAPEGQRQADTPKKDFRSERDSPDTRPSSSTPSKSADTRTTSDRPSVEERLKGYREQMRTQPAPASERTRTKPKQKTN